VSAAISLDAVVWSVTPDSGPASRRAAGMRTGSHRVAPHVSGQSASQRAFEQYVLPEIEVLLRVARSLTRHQADAEDLVQDTLVRAFRAIDRFDGRHPRAWLLTILRNTHINRGRKKRPDLFPDADGGAVRLEATAGTERTDASVTDGFHHEVEAALADLGESFRRVIELVDIAGLPYADAAEILGVPVGTVMSRLHRARARIRDRLDRAGIAPRSH
jgi:RNA polymerase sigma-70 factor (ECF subfamily)